MKKLSPETEAHLHSQLVKLGDMIGDVLHHEPDGKWISRDYKRICKALGLIPARKPVTPERTQQINDRMAQRCEEVACQCGSKLAQTKSGSMRAKCTACGRKYQLLKSGRAKR